jgi:anti-sigma B factor antagonist
MNLPMITTGLSIYGGDGHVVVALRGELDLVDAAYVAIALAAVADREPNIVVDLAGLEFTDSTGVAALARGRRRARQSGGDLRLVAPQRQVMLILSILAPTYQFAVYATTEEAVSSIAGPGGAAVLELRRSRRPPR